MSALPALVAVVGAIAAVWCSCVTMRTVRESHQRALAAYEAAKARAALLSRRAQMEADLFRPVSEWIAEAEAKAERELG